MIIENSKHNFYDDNEKVASYNIIVFNFKAVVVALVVIVMMKHLENHYPRN